MSAAPLIPLLDSSENEIKKLKPFFFTIELSFYSMLYELTKTAGQNEHFLHSYNFKSFFSLTKCVINFPYVNITNKILRHANYHCWQQYWASKFACKSNEKHA